ncbi:MAG: hypothetical protein FWH03_05315 [Firmicutes bacterium]|nr:hypothetical protein [Bacillota bacterium]
MGKMSLSEEDVQKACGITMQLEDNLRNSLKMYEQYVDGMLKDWKETAVQKFLKLNEDMKSKVAEFCRTLQEIKSFCELKYRQIRAYLDT